MKIVIVLLVNFSGLELPHEQCVSVCSHSLAAGFVVIELEDFGGAVVWVSFAVGQSAVFLFEEST